MNDVDFRVRLRLSQTGGLNTKLETAETVKEAKT